MEGTSNNLIRYLIFTDVELVILYGTRTQEDALRHNDVIGNVGGTKISSGDKFHHAGKPNKLLDI